MKKKETLINEYLEQEATKDAAGSAGDDGKGSGTDGASASGTITGTVTEAPQNPLSGVTGGASGKHKSLEWGYR